MSLGAGDAGISLEGVNRRDFAGRLATDGDGSRKDSVWREGGMEGKS